MNKSSDEDILPTLKRQWETRKVSWLSYIFREIFFHFIVPLIPFSWYHAVYSLKKNRYVSKWIAENALFSWITFLILIIVFIISGTFSGESVFRSTFNNGFGEDKVFIFQKAVMHMCVVLSFVLFLMGNIRRFCSTVFRLTSFHSHLDVTVQY